MDTDKTQNNIKRTRLYIRFIHKYDEEIARILNALHELVNTNEDTDFVNQIHLIVIFKGPVFYLLYLSWERLAIFLLFQSLRQFLPTLGLIRQ